MPNLVSIAVDLENIACELKRYARCKRLAGDTDSADTVKQLARTARYLSIEVDELSWMDDL